MGGLEVAPASPDEWPGASRLALGNSPPVDLETRSTRLLQLVRDGRFDPAGLVVARSKGTLVGAIAAQVLPGGAGVVLPPFGPDSTVREALVEAAKEHFRRSDTVVVHCLLDPHEATQAASLVARGFRHVTQIRHMLRRGADVPEEAFPASPTLGFVPYTAALDAVFADTLRRTYIDTLDLPETTVDRPAAQQLEGYRHGQPDPPRWWLAETAGRPVGVVLLSLVDSDGAGEIGYLGLVPEARGRGLGRALVRHAITESARAGIDDLGLSVDARNTPAVRIYRSAMFREYQLEDLYLLRLATAG